MFDPTKKNTSYLLASITVAPFLILSCGNPGTTTPDPNNTNVEGKSCQLETDCGNGYICYQQACRKVCQADTDCTGSQKCVSDVCIELSLSECQNADDCTNPNKDCQTTVGARCEGGQCIYQPMDAGVKCDDGNLCTENDACDGNGVCKGTDMVCNQPPANGCNEEDNKYITYSTTGVCSPTNKNGCVYTSSEEDVPNCQVVKLGKKDKGDDCTSNDDCATNFSCVDGVCCTKSSCGTCESCAVGLGDCEAIPAGEKDSDTCNETGLVCSADKKCLKDIGQKVQSADECFNGIMADGVCCATECEKNHQCSENQHSYSICNAVDSTGTCKQENENCKIGCNDEATNCKGKCTRNEECGDGRYCNTSGDCVEQLSDGKACGPDIMNNPDDNINGACTNYCTDGFCCAQSKEECVSICEDTNRIQISSCSASGVCTAASQGDCPNHLKCADAHSCKESCSSHDDCIDGYFCNNTKCEKKLPDGTKAADGIDNNQCASGIIAADGYCCATECTQKADTCDGSCKIKHLTPVCSTGTCEQKPSYTNTTDQICKDGKAVAITTDLNCGSFTLTSSCSGTIYYRSCNSEGNCRTGENDEKAYKEPITPSDGYYFANSKSSDQTKGPYQKLCGGTGGQNVLLYYCGSSSPTQSSCSYGCSNGSCKQQYQCTQASDCSSWGSTYTCVEHCCCQYGKACSC